jgi:hypothetical protein
MNNRIKTDSTEQPGAAEKMDLMHPHLHTLRRAGKILIVFGIIV